MKSIQFSHIEKAGILLFCTIILGVIVFIEISSKPIENEPLITRETAFDSSDDAIPQKKRKPTKSIGSSKTKKAQHLTGEKFNFDPNTISKDSLIMLGLGRKSAGNLVKYREKGGKFRKNQPRRKY